MADRDAGTQSFREGARAQAEDPSLNGSSVQSQKAPLDRTAAGSTQGGAQVAGAEASLQRLFAGLPAAVFTLQYRGDAGLRCLLANPQVDDLLGLEPGTLHRAVDGLTALLTHVHPDDRVVLRSSLEQALLRRSDWYVTFRIQHPQRGKVWIEGRAAPDAADASLWHGLLTDMGTQRVSGAAPSKPAPHDAALLQHSTDALFLHGDHGVIQQVNAAATQLLGYSRDELVGAQPTLFDPNYESLRGQLELRERLQRGETFTFETVHVRKDGSRFPAEVHLTALQSGEHLQAIASVRDLSQHKRDAAALRDSERRFHQLADLVPGVVWISRRGQDAYVSQRWYEYTGLRDVSAEGLAQVIHPADFASLLRAQDESTVRKQPYRCEFRMRHLQSDTYRWFLAQAVPILDGNGQINEWVGLSIEIDDLKRTEAALREERDRFERLASVAPGVLHTYRLCADGRAEFSYASPMAQTLLGLSSDDLAAFAACPQDFIHPDDLPAVRDAVMASALALSPYHGVYRFLHPTRGERWLEINSAPVREPDGSTVWHGILFDATDRLRAASELRDSEKRYRELADALPQVVWTADAAGQIDFLNAHALDYGGLPRDTLLGWDWIDVIHPDDRGRARANWAEVRRCGVGIEVKLRIRRHDGEYRWHVVRQTPSSSAHGEIVKWIGTCTDIHEIQLYEDALRRERDRFEDLVSAVPGVVFTFLLRSDGHASFPYVSPQTADMFGIDPESLATDAASLLLRIHPEDLARARMSMWKSARKLTVWRTDYRILHEKRREVWVEGLAIPSRLGDGSILWHGFISDITARKQAESLRRHQTLSLQVLSDAAAALLQGADSSTLTRSLFHTAMQHLGCDGFFHYVVDGNRLRLADHAGLTTDDGGPPAWLSFGELLCGSCAESRAELYLPRLQQNSDPNCAGLRSQGMRMYICYPLIDGDRLLGTLAFASRRRDRLSDAERGFVRTFNRYVALSLTRLHSERALRDSEERYRRLMEMLPVAVALKINRKVAFCNPAFVRLLGAETAAQVIGRDTFDIVHPDYHPLLLSRVAQVAKAQGALPGTEARVVRLDGQAVPVYVEVTTFLQDGQPAVMVALSDLTEREAAEAARKKLEEQVRQAHKMEALGRLAGGVAHDFNNLLTVIQGYSDLLLSRPVPATVQHEALTGIQAASERAARLTQQLLALSRKAPIEPKNLDLNVVVHDNVKLLRRLIREDIALSTVLDPQLWRLRADLGQLDQLILNLVVNARDAMPGGGRLCIETQNVEIQAADLGHYPDLKLGPYVRLSVSDTGIGIRREIQGLIFDPFFTTKQPGEGTGLGLSVVHGIVKQAGGHIGVYSEPGVGTTFQILLPALPSPLASRQTPVSLRAAEHGTETLLLVEDDANVRKIARLSLSMYGYRVVEASGGEDALRQADRHDGVIDLLITDLVMPGLSGRQLTAQLRLSRPELRVLYMSGYTDDGVLQKGLIEPSDPFIQKPFTPQQLATKVRSVLDATALAPRKPSG